MVMHKHRLFLWHIFVGELWLVEEDPEVFLDVCGGLHHGGACSDLYLPVWKLSCNLEKHD